MEGHPPMLRALPWEHWLLPSPSDLGVSSCAYLPACVLDVCIFLSGSCLSALSEKQTREQLVLNQHSAGLSAVRCGAGSAPHAVTLLARHQGQTF